MPQRQRSRKSSNRFKPRRPSKSSKRSKPTRPSKSSKRSKPRRSRRPRRSRDRSFRGPKAEDITTSMNKLTLQSPREINNRTTLYDLANKFGDRQIELVEVVTKLSRIFDDRELINNVLLRCGDIVKCKAFVSDVEGLKYINNDKLTVLLRDAGGDASTFLNNAKTLNEYSRSLKEKETLTHTPTLTTFATAGDGACFFRAIAYAESGFKPFLTSTSADIIQNLGRIRVRIMNWVVTNWNLDIASNIKMHDIVRFQHGERGVNTQENYQEYMGKHITYAAQPEVIAAGNIYGLTIFSMWNNAIRTSKYGNGSLHIYFNGINHYSGMQQPSELSQRG